MKTEHRQEWSKSGFAKKGVGETRRAFLLFSLFSPTLGKFTPDPTSVCVVFVASRKEWNMEESSRTQESSQTVSVYELRQV